MPLISESPGTGNFVTLTTTQTITGDKTFKQTSTAIPITAVMDSSTATQPAILAKNNTNFAQAGNILKIQMVNSTDTGDVVKIDNSGTGKSILGTDGSTTQWSISRHGNGLFNATTGITYQSLSATVGTFVLGASTTYMVEDHLEIGATSSVEIPATSRLEIRVYIDTASTQSLFNKTFVGPLWDGWENITADNWSWQSGTAATVGNASVLSNYAIGDRVKVYQNGAVVGPEYFYIVSTNPANPSVGLFGGSDYSLQNSAISAVYISHMQTPVGFPQWFNWAPTVGGFSAAPAGATYRFSVVGRLCTVVVNQFNLGTSNANTFTITTPIASGANAGYSYAIGRGFDNATIITNGLEVSVQPNSSTMNLYKTFADGAWTASSTKGAAFTVSYEI